MGHESSLSGIKISTDLAGVISIQGRKNRWRRRNICLMRDLGDFYESEKRWTQEKLSSRSKGKSIDLEAMNIGQKFQIEKADPKPALFIRESFFESEGHMEQTRCRHENTTQIANS